MPLLREALIFLIATVIAVPISKRLGMGTVLGYLVAGVVIGPWIFAVYDDVDEVMHVAEFGVALLLFVIGLELQPARLWQMRRTVFGLGTAQVLLSSFALAAGSALLGLSWRSALVVGLGLSLSSTAFALQLLAEKKDLASPYGQASFGILLLQDVAVIPMLAVLPILGVGAVSEGLPILSSIVRVIAIVIFLVLTERFVLRRLFQIVAATNNQEVFTATSLLIAFGTAALVSYVGLSMALGAFLAGGLLANSAYRHQLEADIEPFKGLLLGLFFMAVGMSVNLGLILNQPLLVFALVAGLVFIKGGILFALGRMRFGNIDQAWRMALALSQGGEFAFVLFGLAVSLKILNRDLSDLLIAVVTLSMAITPALFTLYERALFPLLQKRNIRNFDVSPIDEPKVIIAGFGRVGQVVARILRAKRIPFTALDSSSEHIDFVRRFGNKVFYGDASRLELLRAAGADKASVFVLAIDDIAASVRTAELVLANFPNLSIVARARNRQHAYDLLNLGVTRFFRETFESSLSLTREVLEQLGFSDEDARWDVERFADHDRQLLLATYKFHDDDDKLAEVAKQARAELESLFENDATVRTVQN